MAILINEVELATNLAHDRTLFESQDICRNQDDMFVDINADELTYTDEIQERFNEWYDFYYNHIINWKTE
jgi:hypothetical protein